MPFAEALQMAQDAGMDLVEVNPTLGATREAVERKQP